MGISGLLPLLKSIQKHCTLKKFAGQTIGIDAYGWLHRGTVACAIELALDKPTTKYVDFAMSRVRMLLDFGVTPYLVFDGDALPSKAGTNQERRKKRDESRVLGLELYKSGKLSQAHQELQKAAIVTPCMARQLIEELKKVNVQYVVAPYEADAQLAYLEQKGIIDGILSEDSDLLVFGAKRLLTKLNQYGECVEIERTDFALCKEISLTGWTDAMFRRMAILSGCDYLTNIDKMGLKTAYRYVRKYKEASKTIQMIQFEGKFCVPADYSIRFQQAELSFLHHRVFCPIERKMVFLTELEHGMKEEDMPFLGPFVDAETAIGVACGDLNPKSKEPISLKTRPSLKENRRQTLASPAVLKPKSSLDSFFKAQRQPLAELDPNSLTPSPSQQRLLERNRNASWEPRMVSSAPQLARTTTSIITEPSTGIASSNTAARSAFLARASMISTYQPPKRQRLCSDNQDPSPTAEEEQSPFFASIPIQPSPLVQKKARNKKAKRTEFDVWSDDSVDDILLGLPDIQQVASPAKDTPAEDAFATPDKEIAESVPQSSPVKAQGSPPEAPPGAMGFEVFDGEDFGSPFEDEELEPFEDLLESHLRTQRESLMKSFVYQLPSRRESALQSLSPSAQVKGAARTFVAQSAETQLSALASLTRCRGVHDECSKGSEQHMNGLSALQAAKQTQTTAEKIELARAALADKRRAVTTRSQAVQPNILAANAAKILYATRSAKNETRSPASTRPSTPLFAGSEDALIPNSEDEGSETDDGAKPKLDLKAFAFVSA